MKYTLLLMILIFIRCKEDDVSFKLEKSTPKMGVSKLINVKLHDVKGDGLTDDKLAIQALIKNNTSLFFPKGTYNISSSISLNSLINFRIIGEQGTVFNTAQNKILMIEGCTSNIEIKNINFVSTKISKVDDPEGLIFIANYGDHDLMDSIKIHDCYFSNPKTHANGIKVVSEGNNSLIKNILIANNRFESIGRMGIEFQNHNLVNIIPRYVNYKILNNYFFDVGTIQTYPAPCCISVSGYAKNGKINNNKIYDMRMNTSSYVYYGIENAGTVGLETKDNYMSSTSFGFTGILSSGLSEAASISTGQPMISNWIIENNIIKLTGSTKDKIKIRGMELSNLDSFNVINNSIKTDGIAIRLVNCKNGLINQNVATVKVGNVIYITEGSTKNTLTLNNLDASKGPDQGVMLFTGINTTRNNAFNNKMIKTGGVPGTYENYYGAYDNF